MILMAEVFFSSFANVCTINGEAFPQGTGRTKKSAKTDAAIKAFTALLEMDNDVEGWFTVCLLSLYTTINRIMTMRSAK